MPQSPKARYRLFLVLAGVLIAASCTHSYHSPNERYVMVAANVQLPYWKEAIAGFMDAGHVMGVKVEVDGTDSYDPQAELDDFNKAVASNPSGILVSPAQAKLFTDAINSAVAKGMPVITIDSDDPDSRRNLFVGTDNERAGAVCGKHLADILHGKGRIVIITIPGQLNLDERLQGVKQVLAGYPNIKVEDTINDQGRTETADDAISKMIAAKKPIDGILCLEASGGPGAAEVLHRLSLADKIKIVAFDKNPETLDWIARGVITGTVAQKPYTMSYYGLTFLDDLHHNAVRQFADWRTAPISPLPQSVDTGTA
ncbi:MAG: substrate-binding domain-containing protein, partial [Acidobacteriota bacterium]|nr:substrate-binding domain-containing protein [Acidobacteriota bacterium]